MQKEIKDLEELTKLVESGESIVVKFYADWCAPCKILQRNVDELERNGGLGENVIYSFNIDEGAAYGVRSIPTTLKFKDGEVLTKKTGVLNLEEIQELFH